MAENSNIEWTHHTFNPWIGCTKVSPGCANCYAETRSTRFPDQGQWGPNGTRRVTSESNWKLPLRWNRAAEKAGERHRVFCASLADVFEADDTMPEASREAVWRARMRLFDLIRRTPHLDWLLLTKRPEGIRHVLNHAWAIVDFLPEDFPAELQGWLTAWLDGSPPHNVWLGTSVENQEQAYARIPHLLSVPAALHFLSMEPLIGEVDVTGCLLKPAWGAVNERGLQPLETVPSGLIGWVIVGGESGKDARPMHPAWVRSIRDQCASAGVPFFFKQFGEYEPAVERGDFFEAPVGVRAVLVSEDGSSRSMRIPGSSNLLRPIGTEARMFRVGKKAAGRLLDGVEHNAVPEVS